MSQNEGFGQCCAEGYVWSGTPKGSMITIGGLPTYVASPPEVKKPESAVLFIHDALSIDLVNNRLLCDAFAAGVGCKVYMPDFFQGDRAIKQDQMEDLLFNKPQTILGKIAKPFQFAINLPSMLLFLNRHGKEATQPLLDAVLDDLKKNHGVKRVGATGYCWGGKYCFVLASQHKIDACVVAHPSVVKIEDLDNINVPVLANCAESDFIFPESLKSQCQTKLQGLGVTHEFSTYPGTTHGFAVRGEEQSQVVLKARDEALKKSVEWFIKYI